MKINDSLMNDYLKEIATTVLKDGLKVYTHPLGEHDTVRNYFYVTDGVNIAYVQYDNLYGATVGTVHKANSNTGTGFRYSENNAPVTLDIIKGAMLCIAPAWNKSPTPQKFKTWDEYAKSQSVFFAYEEVTL